MNKKIVSHLIAGYPSLEGSFEVARALIDGGGYALEVQIPFSDPSADGPTIEAACCKALESGFKVEQGFELIKKIKNYSPQTPVYIMSYASIIFTNGIENFVKKAKEYNVEGLIIPDLVVGSDEGLYDLGVKYNINIVPVLVTSVPEYRIKEIMENSNSDWVYIALRGGITGSYTEITAENTKFLDSVRKYNVKIMAGFGIQSREQIETLNSHVDASVVGSYFVKKTSECFTMNKDIYTNIKNCIKELML